MVKTVPMAECDKQLAQTNSTALCVGTLVAHEGVARSQQQLLRTTTSARQPRHSRKRDSTLTTVQWQQQ
jgi:hypothetical protein